MLETAPAIIGTYSRWPVSETSPSQERLGQHLAGSVEAESITMISVLTRTFLSARVLGMFPQWTRYSFLLREGLIVHR